MREFLLRTAFQRKGWVVEHNLAGTLAFSKDRIRLIYSPPSGHWLGAAHMIDVPDDYEGMPYKFLTAEEINEIVKGVLDGLGS